MRIVGWDEFLTLPKGTLFYKYVPCVVSDLAIKDDTYPDNSDYLVAYTDVFDIVEGTSFEVTYHDSLQRAADYSKGQQFAVFEAQDLVNLMGVCKNALSVIPNVRIFAGLEGYEGLTAMEQHIVTKYVAIHGVGLLKKRVVDDAIELRIRPTAAIQRLIDLGELG